MEQLEQLEQVELGDRLASDGWHGAMITDEQLQIWVERVSMRDFGWPFRHRATFNKRLRRVGGRYHLRSHNLDFDPEQLRVHGADEFEKIIKHELCHYHLHLQKRGYRHRDREFKELLARVGGTRFCKSAVLPERQRAGFRYLLKCRTCATEYPRRIRCNPARYACSKCRGKLDLLEVVSG